MSRSIEAALTAWRDALGPEHVHDDPELRRRLERTTFATDQQIAGRLCPATTAEVQAVVRIAGEHRVPIYPISRGRNWSYGSRVPPRSGCMIVDLRRMNRITDLCEDLGHVTIEPGVTQQQLYDYLEQQGSGLMMSVTGSSPDSSLVGNVVERGLAVGPLGDRFANTCDFEVVLPTGERVCTGYGRFPGARTGPLLRHAVGPALEGMFTQSNLGIVTRMTMWLQPRPPYFQAVGATIRDRRHLAQVVDELRELSQLGLLKGNFGFWNDCKMLAALGQYPFSRAGGTPLPPELRDSMARRAGMGPWILVGALFSGSRQHGLAERTMVSKRIRPLVDRLVFVDQLRASVAKAVSPVVKLLTGEDLAANIDRLYGKSAFLGIPSSFPLRQLYWRRREPVPDQPEPDTDGCGVIACSPTVPFRGRDVHEVTRLVDGLFERYGFEPNVTLICASPRHIDMVALIVYDRDVPGEDERAMALHDHMLREVVHHGFPPYRLGIQSMDAMPPFEGDFGVLQARLKACLDPHGILAPGRYEFSAPSAGARPSARTSARSGAEPDAEPDAEPETPDDPEGA